MINYEYECTECGHNFEIEQSIKAKVKRKCPECKKNALERLISGGNGAFFKGNITTLGQQAEHNYKKNKTRIDEDEAKKKELAPKEEKPWWGGTDRKLRNKLNKMNKDQKKKYIMEGD